MLNSQPLIIKGRKWVSSSYEGYHISYAGDIKLDDILKIIKRFNNINEITQKDINKLFERIKGKFAFIISSKNTLFAAVDRIKSIPIFLATNKKKLGIGNHATPLAKNMHLTKINNNACLSIAMSGYAIGKETIIEGLTQLEAGECFIWQNKKKYLYKYYNYEPWKVNSKKDDNVFKLDLKNLTLDIIAEIINKRDNRQIAVPLSGGFDSRLIISALYKLNAKNIVCYSYGRKNNFEANIAKNIAKKLNYPWYFTNLDNKIQKNNFSSKLYKEYVAYADTLSAFPYVQDLFVVDDLLKKRIISKDTIIINGNSGDFISGGHMPLFSKNENKIENIYDKFITKHCSLWENYFKTSEINIIKNKLNNQIINNSYKDNDNIPSSSIFEQLEFLNRQTKYVIPGQRIYDFYGLDWELPLWHDDYLKFWSQVPARLKLKQKLYEEMLIEENWGNVWKKIPINKKYITPKWIIPLRLLFKCLFIFNKNSLWKNFDQKYFSYWMEIIPHFPAIPYNKVISDKRLARNAVSWHTELYLKNKGINQLGNLKNNKIVL